MRDTLVTPPLGQRTSVTSTLPPLSRRSWLSPHSHTHARYTPTRGVPTRSRRMLDANYPGGLAAYIQTARSLLALAQRGENPLAALAGWVPAVPAHQAPTKGAVRPRPLLTNARHAVSNHA